ncbi:MAG: carboxypeptidase-like regulatory domain-containing protein [Planctomycetaceae bacterium]
MKIVRSLLQSRIIAFSLAATAVLVLCVQFRKDSSARVEVSGLLFFENQPVPQATLFFLPDNPAAGRMLPAVTNDAGWYQVPEGLPPGTYRVAVKGFSERPADVSGLDAGQQTARFDATQQFGTRPDERRQGFRMLPEEFSSTTATQLHLTVPPEGSDSADLFLTSTGDSKTGNSADRVATQVPERVPGRSSRR